MPYDVYYNEFDPFCCQWLRNLMAAGLIPEGEIDGRDIRTVQPDDVRRFRQCHFFAGIGGWALALEWAGWTGPVWTGSCPCQPFSKSGRAKGVRDDRHLWPAFGSLIRECDPAAVLGEQVASPDGRAWLSGVRLDLEAMGYGVGAVDLCAAGFGADHIRQRLYWVADSGHRQHLRRHAVGETTGNDAREEGAILRAAAGGAGEAGRRAGDDASDGSSGSGLADASGTRRPPPGSGPDVDAELEPESGRGEVDGMADAEGGGLEDGGRGRGSQDRQGSRRPDAIGRSGYEWMGNPNPPRLEISELEAVPGAWWWRERGATEQSGSAYIPCRDGAWRRIEPGTFPLAYGIPADLGQQKPGLRGLVEGARRNRTGRLRGYGNAIHPGLAAEFVRAVMEVMP